MTPHSTATLGKNYYSNNGNSTTQIKYFVIATIPLKVLSNLFSKIQLVKGMNLKMVLTLHTHVTTTLTTAAGVYNTAYTTIANNNCCPFQLSPMDPTGTNSNGIVCSAANANITATIGIGKSYGTVPAVATHPSFTQCRLYVPCYTMSAIIEEQYLRAVPQKTLLYNDFASFYSQCVNIAPGSSVNPQLTNSISRLRGLLIIPQLASTVNGLAVGSLGTTSGGTLGSPLISPFSSSPATCAPFARVQNFNVFVSGTAWYSSSINYSFEHFTNEMRKTGAYGNMLPQIASGLIGEKDWENGYGYIYVNFNRQPTAALDNAPRSIQLQLTNASPYTVDNYCFVIYEREITLNTSTGKVII